MDTPLEQKVKGKIQQAKGKAQQQMGQGVKGGIARAKGKINEEIGELRSSDGNRWDDDDWV